MNSIRHLHLPFVFCLFCAALWLFGMPVQSTAADNDSKRDFFEQLQDRKDPDRRNYGRDRDDRDNRHDRRNYGRDRDDRDDRDNRHDRRNYGRDRDDRNDRDNRHDRRNYGRDRDDRNDRNDRNNRGGRHYNNHDDRRDNNILPHLRRKDS